jgi:tRNA pseudouridine38-40 synthase
MRDGKPVRDGKSGRPARGDEKARDRKPRPDREAPAARDDRRPSRGDSSRAPVARGARPGMTLPPPHKRLRNVKLLIEYDGSRYAGWQVQPNARTVAGEIEKALSEVIGEDVRIVGAGRTDEGVHAEGQVANFLSRWRHPSDGLAAALNDRLPDDIGIVEAIDVGPEFHARHSAAARVYRYHVLRRRSVFMRRRAMIVSKPLDPKLMKAAADLIIGMHDFAAFTDLRLHHDGSTKVQVTYAGWKDVGSQLVFRISGSHFLPRMVRRLVGCMVKVGTGELPLATFTTWLETAEGESGPHTAPAMGLYLEHVEYPAAALRSPGSWRPRDETHPVAEQAVEAFEALERGEGGEAESANDDTRETEDQDETAARAEVDQA